MSNKLDSLNLLYYTAPMSFAMLLPAAFFAEFGPLSTWISTATGSQLLLLSISGAIAYLLSKLSSNVTAKLNFLLKMCQPFLS